MKKILKKLKSVNKQITEFENELKNIRSWDKLFCRHGEKERQIQNHEHFIAELKETKIEYLKALQAECGLEIKKLSHEYAAAI